MCHSAAVTVYQTAQSSELPQHYSSINIYNMICSLRKDACMIVADGVCESWERRPLTQIMYRCMRRKVLLVMMTIGQLLIIIVTCMISHISQINNMLNGEIVTPQAQKLTELQQSINGSCQFLPTLLHNIPSTIWHSMLHFMPQLRI